MTRYAVSDTPPCYEHPNGQWVQWEDVEAQERRLDALEEKWRTLAKDHEAEGEFFTYALLLGVADELRAYREVEQS